MNTLLDALGTALWRVSWQAMALTVLVALLLWALGERIAPRWRYLLWSVVLLRLLLVATPAAPWSAFNLVRWEIASGAQPIAHSDDSTQPASAPGHACHPNPRRSDVAVASIDPARELGHESALNPHATAAGPADLPSIPPAASAAATPSAREWVSSALVLQAMLWLWLAGCLFFGLRLLITALVLRRRLSVCRPVTDPSAAKILAETCEAMGLRRRPVLVVTPESLSPCLVGVRHPRIVLPELLATHSSPEQLRHVLAHEVAHVARGDLWTNWLLLVVRVFHWFNPAAWWTIREMQAERETACDELALAALPEEERTAYVATIVDVATTLTPCALAPGMIGFFASKDRMRTRVDRLLCGRAVSKFGWPVAASLLLAIALIGLTDALPGTAAEPKPAKDEQPAAATTQKEQPQPPAAKAAEAARPTVTLRGQCIDGTDRTPLSGVQVRMFKVQGWTEPIVEAAKALTDAEGKFEFADVAPPRADDPVDRLLYVLFAEAEGRPIGMGGTWTLHERDPFFTVIPIARDQFAAAGIVRNREGRPVAGATVAIWSLEGRAAPGLVSAVSGPDGRFEIKRIPDYARVFQNWSGFSFHVTHPDYAEANVDIRQAARDLVAVLPYGSIVSGSVVDDVTGRPGAGAVVTLRGVDANNSVTVADARGKFRVVVPEGRYHVLAEAEGRVCAALIERDCVAREQVALPPLKLIQGGFIYGQVVNSATGDPIATTDDGRPITIGLFGPSQPQGKAVSPTPRAIADENGRFILRAAPGNNFPYFVNIRGDRMSWDTLNQPPVVVKDKETTFYKMTITPEVPPEEKLRQARAVVAGLSKQPLERTAQILEQFRKLNRTVDETELWCSLMRELIAVGRDAVPALCAELDQTTENRMLRRLGFALRAIGDPRAVPALIRAIPKTLLPSSSDYGLIVNDRELAAFMQQHDLSPGGGGGVYFDLGRPEREIVGALRKLTGQDFEDAEVLGISLSQDPRGQILQRRLFVQQARRWQAWWEANWRTLTDDAAYGQVNLPVTEETLPAASRTLGPAARLSGVMRQAVISPPVQEGQYAWHFYDLDTGRRPRWPAEFPRDEARIDRKQLDEWAEKNGVDLMCITHRASDGTETFVLRTLGMTVREIEPRDVRNLDKLVAAGKLPEGRAVDELLMHYDLETRRLVPDADGAFLFVTREGSMGLIETTDRVTRTADITGMPSAPKGVGFHKGVKFDLKAIIP